MGVYKLSAAGTLKTGRTLFTSMLAGNPVFVESSYESIATVTLSTATASITFSGIPATYTHLQVRGMYQGLTNCRMRFNGDSGSNYSQHYLVGDGSATGAGAQVSASFINIGFLPSISSNIFYATITDILDYANTNKNKTTRTLNGIDRNGSGQVGLDSGAYYSLSAINSITISASGGNLAEYSSFALYGIRGN